MRRVFVFALFVPTFVPQGFSQTYTISTAVGRSVITEGGAATEQPLANLSGVAVDADGNVYIAAPVRNRVYKVTPAGILTTFAGTRAGFSGDGGPATQARLRNPQRVAVLWATCIYLMHGTAEFEKLIRTERLSRLPARALWALAATTGLPLPRSSAIQPGWLWIDPEIFTSLTGTTNASGKYRPTEPSRPSPATARLDFQAMAVRRRRLPSTGPRASASIQPGISTLLTRTTTENRRLQGKR